MELPRHPKTSRRFLGERRCCRIGPPPAPYPSPGRHAVAVPLTHANPDHHSFVPTPDPAVVLATTRVDICLGEVRRALQTFPLAFRRGRDTVGLIAVLGARPDRNLFVTEDGRWLCPYVPAVSRAWPFSLGPGPEGRHVVCIDETCGGLRSGPDAHALFEANGQPAPFLQQIASFLGTIGADLKRTRAAAALLDRHGLLTDWAATARIGDADVPLAGLLRVDEAALRGLSPEALAALRDAGALELAYAQLHALPNLAALEMLARTHARADARQQEQARETAEMFQFDDVTFNFD
nr:SapC family protein [Roseospira navarrensis]